MNLDNIKIDGTIKSKELNDGRIVTYMIPKQVELYPFKSFNCKCKCKTNIEIVGEFSETETVKARLTRSNSNE